MTQAELLDALARAIDAPRHDGRHKKIKVAFVAYTESLANKKHWWKFWTREEETRPFWV